MFKARPEDGMRLGAARLLVIIPKRSAPTPGAANDGVIRIIKPSGLPFGLVRMPKAGVPTPSQANVCLIPVGARAAKRRSLSPDAASLPAPKRHAIARLEWTELESTDQPQVMKPTTKASFVARLSPPGTKPKAVPKPQPPPASLTISGSSDIHAKEAGQQEQLDAGNFNRGSEDDDDLSFVSRDDDDTSFVSGPGSVRQITSPFLEKNQ